MTEPYDEQAGFRKKTGEKEFKIRRVGGRSGPASPTVRDTGGTLLDQVAGEAPGHAVDEAPRDEVPAAAHGASAFVAPTPAAPVNESFSRPRFSALLSGQSEHTTEAVSGAYNGIPLKPLLRRIAERHAMNRPSGFDEWR